VRTYFLEPSELIRMARCLLGRRSRDHRTPFDGCVGKLIKQLADYENNFSLVHKPVQIDA
jgi:hypothetical protein